MKTFKLVSLQLFDKNGEANDIPFRDALIINKENDANEWLIELFFDQKYLPLFNEYGDDESFAVEVTITKKENPPAGFLVKKISTKLLDPYVSVLLIGTMQITHRGFAEKVLEKLMSTGLAGPDLLSAFQESMNNPKKRYENGVSSAKLKK